MVVRKITIDNSVRFILRSEQIKERDIEPKTIKAGYLPRIQNKKIHKTIKSSFIMFQQADLEKVNE